MGTAISWTNETWNPTTGCSRISDGCRNCYAEQLSLSRGWSAVPWTANNAEQNVKLHPDRLRKPLSWREPKRVFVNSMSDVFHPLIPFEYVDRIFDTMEQAERHTFQVLTKRPERMAEYTRARYATAAPPRNIWLGTSIEDHRVLDRLDHLRDTVAGTKFVSAEPLIGSLIPPEYAGSEGTLYLADRMAEAGVAWVIVGGESGPDYRPMDMAWAREARDACEARMIAFFFKQDSARRTETRTYLVEADGRKVQYQQYPDSYDAPVAL